MHERLVEDRGVDLALLDGAAHVVVRGLAAEVEPALDRRKVAFDRVLPVLVVLPDVVDCSHIADDGSPEAPLAAQDVDEKPLVRAARDAVDRRVRAHHALDLRLLHERLERREVIFVEIAVVEVHVELVALLLGTGVDGVVLRARDGLQVLRVVALNALHERDAHARGEVWVLAERLLPAPPARIAVHVDVRAPQRKTVVPAALALGAVQVHLSARLGRNRIRHPQLELVVERRRRADRLREHRRESAPRVPVQRLAPPVEARDPDALDLGIVHHEHLDLLVRRQLFENGPRLLLRLRATRVVRNGTNAGGNRRHRQHNCSFSHDVPFV